jgi:hypothetical protein
MIKNIVSFLRAYHAPKSLGLAAILTLGCDDSIGPPAPTTGSIEITVSTAGENIDVDPDGYILSIDGVPALRRWLAARSVGVNATLTVGSLPTGRYLVRLDGLAANCSVSSPNPRSVDVTADEAAFPVPFSVTCLTKTGTGAGDWDY